MVMIIGRSSGVSPTASASAKIRASIQGRWNAMLSAITSTMSTRVMRRISMLNRRSPISKEVGGGFAISVSASLPSVVGRQLGNRQAGFGAVATHIGAQRHLLTQRIDGILRLALLREVKQHGEQHD